MTEAQLIDRAREALSDSSWVIGECAAQWTKKYAKGRTDADFGAMVGLSGDQIYQRRRVWESFGDVRDQYSNLRWSHYYISLTWDDAPECLQWAEENKATVAELKAWRRAIHGEDLSISEPFEEYPADSEVTFLSDEPTSVKDPSGYGQSEQGGLGDSGLREQADSPATVGGHARDMGNSGNEYSPFRSGAASPAPKGSGSEVSVVAKPELTPEQAIKRICTAVERSNQMLTPSVQSAFSELSPKLKKRFIKAVSDLNSVAAKLQ
ncbi:MAG: hypothetical protein K0U86_16400 [Planctomycetes bacterium]|nr:hypothetical protein [Planctomycetota bacterium]MCH9726483.1 hypothetical protein [Planctomycetota bacterium]MCH9778292.1 hypothetical protein [Planctomycetota bacterium]MCH9791707.1 hypothetical protein [Planctomycetota bacterium]MDF1743662.1 hypothetical protein [Gimesia sp.]